MAAEDFNLSVRFASYTVTIDCPSGNDYDGRLGLRISAIFVIFIGSLLGCLVPMLLASSSELLASKALFVIKYFGSGVIVGTAFIHLLAPAVAALHSPCLNPESPISRYPWPEGICLMTVFAMFLAELLVRLYATNMRVHSAVEQLSVNVSPLGNNSKSAEERRCAIKDSSDDGLPVRLTTIFILEFGVVFHSVLIGLTLAVAGDEFTVLYIVLAFHQTFEGLGLGSRFATTAWDTGKQWLPYVLSVAYSLSTPIAIAVGLGLREKMQPAKQSTLVVSGVFDSISAGILLYTGLVEFIAREVLLSVGIKKESVSTALAAFGCMSMGAGLMALLGYWA